MSGATVHSPNPPSWCGAQFKRSTEADLRLPNIIRVIKSRRMRWAGDVARCIQNFSQPEEQRLLGRHGSR
jgi:hypothetical protein